MDAPFRATHQTKRMLYEMMLCAEHRGAYVGYVRGEFSRTLTGFFQEVSSAFRFPYTFSWSWESLDACFRDLEWEEKVLKICRESGVGAQFGGKYLVHDVRVIRAPRHAASCPVAIGVSCSADRNIKAKITPEGIFLEELEKNPARFLPKEAPGMSPAVEIDLDEGMDKVREILYKIWDL